jgi:16S rRNA (uracil1498-N3)-methyltransferase
MRVTRIFFDGDIALDSELKLSGHAASHVARVLRLHAGAELTLFNGRGGEYGAVITRIAGATVAVRPHRHNPIERESPLRLTLLQSIARGEKMDWVVQKATELGVARIVPVFTERTVVRLNDEQAAKRAARWRGVAIAACEQCGRNRVPRIAQPVALEACLRENAATGGERRLLLDPASGAAIGTLDDSRDISLLIGPEGGLPDHERALAAQAGFRGARLGPRTLRTETAALAAIVLLQGRLGDFR